MNMIPCLLLKMLLATATSVENIGPNPSPAPEPTNWFAIGMVAGVAVGTSCCIFCASACSQWCDRRGGMYEPPFPSAPLSMQNYGSVAMRGGTERTLQVIVP